MTYDEAKSALASAKLAEEEKFGALVRAKEAHHDAACALRAAERDMDRAIEEMVRELRGVTP